MNGFNVKSKNIVKCRRHPQAYLVEDHRTGDILCETCGLVVDRVYDERAEWRTFEGDSIEKSRVGGPENSLLGSAFNLSTNISAPQGGPNRFGRFVQNQYKRRSVDKALKAGFEVITTTAARLNLLASVVQRACFLYRTVYVQRAYKGNIIFHEPKTAACVYIASHYEHCPRTSSEVCAASGYSRADISRWASIIIRELKLTFDKPKVVDYIPRFCGVLNVPKQVRQAAQVIARKIDQTGFFKEADCLAAAAISLADPTHTIEDEEISERLNVPIDQLTSFKEFVKNL